MKIPVDVILYLAFIIAFLVIAFLRLKSDISKRKKIIDNPNDTIANNIKEYGMNSFEIFFEGVFGFIGELLSLAIIIVTIILIVWGIKWLWFKLPIR